MIVKHGSTLATRELERLARLENRVGLGWFRYSDDVSNYERHKDFIERLWGIQFKPRGRGWQGYSESIEAPFGIILACSPYPTQAEREELGVRPSPNEGRMTVDIPQSAMDSLTGEELLEFLVHVRACDRIKVTRLDVYHDDFCKIISPVAVHHGVERGGIGIPRYRNIKGIANYNHQKGVSTGYTFYAGSPKSGKMLRFYDKSAESGGEIDCYRWEMEFTNSYAEVAGETLLKSLEKAFEAESIENAIIVIENTMKSLISGSISFHEIPIGKSTNELERNWAKRCPLTWWWKEIIAGLKPAKLTLNKRKPSLSGTISWLKSKVMPKLALAYTALDRWGMHPRQWLMEQIEAGSDRWNAKHLAELEEALLSSPAY